MNSLHAPAGAPLAMKTLSIAIVFGLYTTAALAACTDAQLSEAKFANISNGQRVASVMAAFGCDSSSSAWVDAYDRTWTTYSWTSPNRVVSIETLFGQVITKAEDRVVGAANLATTQAPAPDYKNRSISIPVLAIRNGADPTDLTYMYDVTVVLSPSGTWAITGGKATNLLDDGVTTRYSTGSGANNALYDAKLQTLTLPRMTSNGVMYSDTVLHVERDTGLWGVVDGTAIQAPTGSSMTVMARANITPWTGLTQGQFLTLNTFRVKAADGCSIPSSDATLTPTGSRSFSSTTDATAIVETRDTKTMTFCNAATTGFTCQDQIFRRAIPKDPQVTLFRFNGAYSIAVEGALTTCNVGVFRLN